MLHRARKMEKVYVCGAGSFVFDYESIRESAEDVIIKERDPISIDGTNGEVFIEHEETTPSKVMRILNGEMLTEQSYTYRMFDAVMSWADKYL